MSRSAALRRFGLRDAVVHGDRLNPAHVVDIADDTLASADVLIDLSKDDWHISSMDPLPCPITVAWSEKDALLPMADYAGALPQRLPAATFTVLAGVGHEPMTDDPRLVAQTILATTGAVMD
jgi:pimeloyl-ACP methyl ester carboxylesterase